MDEPEQRALAGTGMPGDEQHLARSHFETDVGQRMVTAVVALADIVETQDAHSIRSCSQFSGKYRVRARGWLVSAQSVTVEVDRGRSTVLLNAAN
jgi:hypothetical protein